MATNGKQKETSSKGKLDSNQLSSLVGRVGKLNELARQHAASSGEPVKRISAGGSSGGGSGIGAGGSRSGKSAPPPAPPVSVKTVPKKKKKKTKQKPSVATTIESHGADGSVRVIPTTLSSVSRKSTQRHYRNGAGKVIATTTIALPTEFDKRAKQVKTVGFHKKAVGLAESSLYHGSHPIEGDFTKSGIRGTRVAGNQYMDVVETPTGQDVPSGCRLTFQLVNPEALGAILKKQAQVYEQSKFNHFKLVYKPVVPATEPGSIAIYFRNDTQNPIYQVGLDELKAASTHQSFIETQVWNPCELSVDPSDIVKKYWDEVNGDVATEVQGMVTVITSSTLTGSKTFGHLYLEYDVEFFSPELDYEVEEIDVVRLQATWNAVNVTNGSPIRLVGAASTAASQTFQFQPGSEVLPNGEYLLYGVVEYVNDDFGLVPLWSTQSDTETHSFAIGQGFYFRFAGNTNVWTDSTMTGMLFADLQSAMSVAGDDDPTDGQLVYAGTQNGRDGNVGFRFKNLPLHEGQD